LFFSAVLFCYYYHYYFNCDIDVIVLHVKQTIEKLKDRN
jgi:hypothetical protein